MDSNPTICEEILTTSNPNRKEEFVEKQMSIDGYINSVKIYKLFEKVV